MKPVTPDPDASVQRVKTSRWLEFLIDIAITVVNELVFGTIARVIGGALALGVAFLLYAMFG